MDKISGPPDKLLLFLGVFAVYLYCAYPAFAPRDSADLALAALNLGVAHPPGYPLYAVLGRAWLTLLPLGNPAYRLNLLSAAAGAAAAVCVYMIVQRRAGFWPALGAALALAFSAPLWKFSLLNEMYSLHALFVAWLVLLAQGDGTSPMRRACLSALLFGLGLVNHQSLILLLPALVFLWRAELIGLQINASALLGRIMVFWFLGFALYAAVILRLRDFGLGWAVITRSEYGSFELFGGFSRQLNEPLALKLLGHLALGLISGGSVLAAGLAGLGVWATCKQRSRFGMAMLIGLGLFGPLFFLMTRFDLSNWVAQTVLETAFIIPTLFLCLLAGLGLKRLPQRAVTVAALAMGVSAFWLHGALMNHRDDFSAYDYIRDLRSALPPGSAAVVAGDTALFGLKYWEAWKRDAHAPGVGRDSRLIVGARELDLRRWIEGQLGRRPVYVTGLSQVALGQLGLWGKTQQVFPAGLAQRIGEKNETPESAAWQMSVLRKSRSLENGESYAHDIRLAYAFAHYLSAHLAADAVAAENHSREAAVLDPEDYRLAP
ncbi:MAG: hypothetical protein A3J74_02905 [Elusimicrobia bacterium RIFCSPHIGHO2_02_FULL_57_9]|nr:MAG: hypothetical protein A3J74_02905 [Elusimicrobia bacterium RIFCSPHIGHO2_02_FULL_57_9]